MSRWFRHYAGMARDEKLVRAALRSKQSVERVVWIWTAILESAAEHDNGGAYEIDHAEVAYFLRCDEGDVDAVIDALAALGRVHEGAVARWATRQYQSDRSAERTQRYRDRHKTISKSSSADDVTAEERHSDGGVTPQNTETETDTETEVPTSSDDVPPSPKKAVSVVVGLGPKPEEPDARTDLFQRSLKILMHCAGYPDGRARGVLGKWLRDAHDEAALVSAVIDEAASVPRGDFVAYVTGAIASRMGARASPYAAKPGTWAEFNLRANG